MIYKVSYVVRGGSHPGAILDAEKIPQVGDTVVFGGQEFRLVEVMELMPSRGGFGFLHATCVPIEPDDANED
jgi:hypothetical protein